MTSRRQRTRFLRPLFVSLALLSMGCSTAVHCAAQRMVFAHYMLTNQDYQADDDPLQERKIAAYEQEIKQAQSIGIDGFALNAGGWLRETYYIRYAAQMFEAALRLHSGFKLMFSADMCCGNGVDDVEDMMRRFAGNPRYADVYFRYRGRFVLTTFAGDELGPAVWQQIRDDLARGTHPSTLVETSALAEVASAPSNAPLPFFLVPAFFWGGELPGRMPIQQGVDSWKSILDGAFYWGIAGVPGSGGALDQTKSADAYASVLHHEEKLFMAPICLQFWGANANRYYEYSGAAGMRAMWMDAINFSHPEWVEIITWNDFIEGTYVSPIDDPNKYVGANFLGSSGVPLNTRDYFHSHAGVDGLLAFFIEWYKTGMQPVIKRDAVYFFYRTQLKDVDAGHPSVSKKIGTVADVIYITANLTAPAEVRVTMGEHTRQLRLASGSSDLQIPLFPGQAPSFVLLRKKRVLASASGKDPIVSSPPFNDYYYSTGQLTARP